MGIIYIKKIKWHNQVTALETSSSPSSGCTSLDSSLSSDSGNSVSTLSGPLSLDSHQLTSSLKVEPSSSWRCHAWASPPAVTTASKPAPGDHFGTFNECEQFAKI